MASLRAMGLPVGVDQTIDLRQAREVLAAVEKEIHGEKSLQSLIPAVQAEIAVAAAEGEAKEVGTATASDPLFRLRTRRWAVDDCDLATLVPVRDPQLRVIEFDYDVSKFIGARTAAELPAIPASRRSYLVAFAHSGGEQREPLLVDGLTARILEYCDGARTIAEIVKQLDCEGYGSDIGSNTKWIENIFLYGLVWLRDAHRSLCR